MPQILARFLWCSYPSHTPSHPLLFDLQIYIPHKEPSVVHPLYFDLQIYITTRRRRGWFDFLSPIAVGYAQPQ